MIIRSKQVPLRVFWALQHFCGGYSIFRRIAFYECRSKIYSVLYAPEFANQKYQRTMYSYRVLTLLCFRVTRIRFEIRIVTWHELAKRHINAILILSSFCYYKTIYWLNVPVCGSAVYFLLYKIVILQTRVYSSSDIEYLKTSIYNIW